MRDGHPSRFAGIAWFLFVILFVSAMMVAGYFSAIFLLGLFRLALAPLWLHVVGSLLGLFFSGLLVGGFGRLARAWGWFPERNVFAPILEALERISKGDFGIRLEDVDPDNQMFGRLASSVNKMASELEQMESLRQEFISNVSHEIQSPLTSIRGFAQALQNESLSLEERRHYLGIIETESTRLSRITENLLRLSALDSEHAHFDPQPYRLDKQIRGLILACEPQWTEKRLEMNVSLNEVEIAADEDLLSQVWTNLIHNSIKFTPPGGQIWVELALQGEQALVCVRDSGIGIAAVDQERIFERFYKADRSRTRAAGGSGLGLAIAKKIVAMHHGQISVSSIPNQGATFTVSLPVKYSSHEP
jgi:signal transduction histidine kinase